MGRTGMGAFGNGLSVRIFRQMKNKVMKAVLSVLEGLAMSVLVATIFGAIGYVVLYPVAYLMGAV